MEPMNLLVTLDQRYLPPLQVLLTSLHITHPNEPICLYVLQRGLSKEALSKLEKQCALFHMELYLVTVDSHIFDAAPVTRQYPQEMYYRLLAPHLLPAKIHRILYLDPDILVLNSLRPLWELDLTGFLWAAASHKGKTELMNNINQVRLGTENKYFNSRVLLMNLDAGRERILPSDIFHYAETHAKDLLLPDQDILNALYGSQTAELDDTIWNYDARNFSTYLLRSGGVCDIDWVMEHTALLHFCGKAKPWQPGYHHRFGILYKHYQQLTRRTGYFLETS